MSVDFPAPEGPIIATSSPLLNFPEIPFNRVLKPEGDDDHVLICEHTTIAVKSPHHSYIYHILPIVMDSQGPLTFTSYFFLSYTNLSLHN